MRLPHSAKEKGKGERPLLRLNRWRIGIGVVLALVAVGGCGIDEDPVSVPITQSATPTAVSANTATASPAEFPTATEEANSNANESSDEDSDMPDGTVFTLPTLDFLLLHYGEVQGEPFDREGEMPEQIIATTDTCQIISIDSATGAVTILWEYPDVRIIDRYEGDSSLYDWIPCDYLIELEWVNPSYVLVSVCCEPASGRVDIINISTDDGPAHLRIAGETPSVNSEQRMARVYTYGYVVPMGEPAHNIGIVPWNLQIVDTYEGRHTYSILGEGEYYWLSLSPETRSDISTWLNQVSWVGDDKIAVELWTARLFPKVYGFIALLDIPSQSITVKSRGHSWMMPTGDAFGNLVVAEQSCYAIPLDCDILESKLVVLDSDTLEPIHEMSFDQNIAELDLARGWLLVTFADGQVGTLDLADGTFTPIANGIVTATWME